MNQNLYIRRKGKIVARISIEDNEFCYHGATADVELKSLWVHPLYRRNGFGTRLVIRAVRKIADRGIAWFCVCPAPTYVARNFWSKFNVPLGGRVYSVKRFLSKYDIVEVPANINDSLFEPDRKSRNKHAR